MGLKALHRKRDAILADAAKVQTEIDSAKGRKLLVCNHCGRRTAVRLLTYIQCHWYRAPYGCTGGDRWCEGEGRFLCPKCGWENRLIYRKEVVKLKRFFLKTVERYDDPREHVRKWCN